MQEVTPEQRHLILANLRRRHRFRYARRHQQKLDQPAVQSLVVKPKPLKQAAEDLQKAAPGDYETQASDDQNLPSPTEDSSSTSLPTVSPRTLRAPEMSATAPSVAEGDILQMAMPTAASRVSVSVATMHYPSPPPTSQQMRGFKCPCCYQTLPEMFKDWSRWRKHLVEDLCPYTCPFLECPRPEILYISRAAWRDHVFRSHNAGQYWECLACAGTELSNTFLSAEEFVSHNRAKHKDAISEDQIIDLQDTCRKITLPSISQCPLCPWPQDEEAIPDAATNLEHVANCIHEFSLNALPWAESLTVDVTDQLTPAFCRKIQEWLECTEESGGINIQKIDIKSFIFLPAASPVSKPERAYIPEEYFAESSKESSQVEPGSLSTDSDLPEVRGTYSDGISDRNSEEVVTDQITENIRSTSAVETTEPLANDDYAVGWICAITTAYNAARVLLDERHDGPEYVSPNDDNSYTLGRIGKHNVVIAMGPNGEYGTASATIVAKNLLYSFPNVRICLMVSIGGGAPSINHDIRLSDVVVGAPHSRSGGVLQYDFSKTIQDQRFQLVNFLDQPPMILRTAMSQLILQYKAHGHHFEHYINSALEELPGQKWWYRRPHLSSDRLYKSHVIHPPGGSMGCAAFCGDDLSCLLHRAGRTEFDINPAIHYGIIASANQLIKDAMIRDRLAAEMDVSCVETETAGLPNRFPCLVIRGICDYSDSHKNKEWHGYAAMTAAAYAKDLMNCINPDMVKGQMKISDVLKSDENSTASLEEHVFSDTSAVDKDEDSGSHILERSLTVAADPAEPKKNPRNLPNISKDTDSPMQVAPYQPIILCDDSSSMNIGTRRADQSEFVRRAARIFTSVIPAGYGTGPQFINCNLELDMDLSSALVGRTMKMVQPNKIGTSLERKILKPLVYDVITEGGELKRPLFILCIIGGCPSGESPDKFKRTILDCVQFLKKNAYPPTAIRFHISQIGNDSHATAFVDGLRKDVDLQDVLSCTAQRVDGMSEQMGDNEEEFERSLLHILLSPILSLGENEPPNNF